MSNQSEFIDKVGSLVQHYAKERGYKVASPIIAQSILESGWGATELAKKANNLFGMKAGSSWKGEVYRIKTAEQKPDGTVYYVYADFRKYKNYEECIKGYFNFISTPRYENLKNATTALEYLHKIKDDGYATDIKYVDKTYNIVQKYNLQKFDNFETIKYNQDEIPVDLNVAINTFANYVIAGMLGNGEERKQRILKLIQDRVNERLKG